MQLQMLLALLSTIAVLFINVNECAPTTAKALTTVKATTTAKAAITANASTTVKAVTIVTEAPVLVVSK